MCNKFSSLSLHGERCRYRYRLHQMSLCKELAVLFHLNASNSHQGATEGQKGRETEEQTEIRRRAWSSRGLCVIDVLHTLSAVMTVGEHSGQRCKAHLYVIIPKLFLLPLLLVQPWKILTMCIWKDANLEQCFS